MDETAASNRTAETRTHTLQIRLSSDESQALVELAKQRKLPVSTMVRNLVLSELLTTGDDAQQILDRIIAQIEQLRQLIETDTPGERDT